ncbi:MAG: NAD(P)-binding protein [Deltaproteobacteria bacterium]|nr:NAD(P)-binding protein [Deltaproteobacteria bacterium]MBW2398680.1 NAD(P)-binding protein [Deltaproteobacteria bacterium]
MDREISRRDFLNGVGAVAAGTLVPGCVGHGTTGSTGGAVGDPANYPPIRSGMRGSHVGSFEVAHELALQGKKSWGAIDEPDTGIYDLVVVGGGISGLSAAYLYLRKHPSARILILDNHDDFGGHAKRNEFQVGDRTVIGYGGSQTLESPQYYSDIAKQLLGDIGVDLEQLKGSYDLGFYRRHGLAGGTFFDRATYGVDRVVRFEIADYSAWLPLASSSLTASEAVARMPISDPARVEMLRLLEVHENLLTEIPADRQGDYLETISYRTFLERHLGIREPELFALFDGIATETDGSIDVSPALMMLDYVGLPGIGATSLHREKFEEDPYIAHFPDGNASIARLFVRAMIPRVAPGSTMEDIVDARFDYSRLDESSSRVRLRLSSTAVRVEHDGAPDTADRVAITYVRGGRADRVWARACVLAGYNAMIPHLCPELPERQREALALAVKVPIIYSTVLLRNWRAWKQLGIGAVAAPGSYHASVMLDFPVSLGGYEFSGSPDDPIAVNMVRFGKITDAALSPRERFRAERHRMLATPFSEIEREIRTQLTGMLESGGFDPARDIEAITVNRWAHGYAYYYNEMFDSLDATDELPHVIGRARFGRIAIANSDAGAMPTIDSAIDQAHRAIEDLAQR